MGAFAATPWGTPVAPTPLVSVTDPLGSAGNSRSTPGYVNPFAPMGGAATSFSAPGFDPNAPSPSSVAGPLGQLINNSGPADNYNFTPNPTPTAPTPFGSPTNPYTYATNPTTTNSDTGQVFPNNPTQFATPETQAAMAQMFGGAPTQSNLGGMFSTSTPQLMVGNGSNAGLLADLVSKYGVDYARNIYNRDQGGADMSPSLYVGGPSAQEVAKQGSFTAPTTTGGGSLNPTTPNIFLPPPVAGSGGMFGQGSGNSGLLSFLNQFLPQPATPDQFLADYTNNTGYLTGMAQNAGYATDATPAWQAMVQAQQRQQDKNFANLQAGYAASGNRFSSDFGSAATDYWNQATLDQNSLLGQMMMQSQEAARGRELSADTTLAQQGFSGAQQLSGQGFQGSQQAQIQQLQAALAMLNAGSGSANLMAQIGAQGAQGLQAGAITGAQGMFSTENQAALAEMQRQMMLQQMGIGAAGSASQLWQSNLGLGNAIGSTQFGANNQMYQAQLQEWLRTQPQYNPLLQMIYGSATSYPPTSQATFNPSQLGSILGGAGAIAGGAAALIPALVDMWKKDGGGKDFGTWYSGITGGGGGSSSSIFGGGGGGFSTPTFA